MIYPSSNLFLKRGVEFTLSLACSTCYTTTLGAEMSLGTLRAATRVQGCTDLFLSSAPWVSPPLFLFLSLPFALQGAWSPSQLLETSVQACHELEDNWILEGIAIHASVCVCEPVTSPQNETIHLKTSS